MARETFKVEIVEVLGALEESDKHDWCKAVARLAWANNPTTLDIRKMNVTQNKFGRGISLSDEQADALVDLLVNNDYGSIDTLEKAVQRKQSRFTLDVPTPDEDAGTLRFDWSDRKINYV